MSTLLIRDLKIQIFKKFYVLSRAFNSYCIKIFLSSGIANPSKTVSVDCLKPAHVDSVKLPETWTGLRKRGRPRIKRHC